MGPRPPRVGRSKWTKYQYRANAYKHYKDIPMILKMIKRPDTLKKRLKRYIRNNDDLPTNTSHLPANGNPNQSQTRQTTETSQSTLMTQQTVATDLPSCGNTEQNQ